MTKQNPRLHEPPPLFKRFEKFRPGNKRIVEYNINSHSVRLRSTPSSMANKMVMYLPTGPKLLEAYPMYKRNGIGKLEVVSKQEEMMVSDEEGGFSDTTLVD